MSKFELEKKKRKIIGRILEVDERVYQFEIVVIDEEGGKRNHI